MELSADGKKGLALDYIEVCIKYNDKNLNPMLTGSFSIDTYNANGEVEQSIWAVMEGIYDYYREHPTADVVEMVNNSFESVFDNLRHPRHIINVIKCIEYQMMCEKQGTAPFKINCMKLLNEAADYILKNKERYQMMGYYDQFEAMDKDIQNNYGGRIIWTEDELNSNQEDSDD